MTTVQKPPCPWGCGKNVRFSKRGKRWTHHNPNSGFVCDGSGKTRGSSSEMFGDWFHVICDQCCIDRFLPKGDEHRAFIQTHILPRSHEVQP